MKNLTRARRALWLLSPALPALVGTWACSPSAGSGADSTGTTTGGGGAGSTTGGGGDGTGTGSTPGGGGDPGTILGGATGGGTSTGPDGGCFATVSKAENTTTTVTTTQTILKPVDMFIMYDQSGSMNEGVPGNTTKWEAIKTALTGFVQDPASDGIGVGIQYFPLRSGPTTCQQGDPNCSCQTCNCVLGFLCWPLGCTQGSLVCTPTAGGDCNVADYANPDVPIQLLPGVAPAIVSSLGAHSPGQGTPTVPALTGAIQYAAGWAASHLGDGGVPARKTIVVLATDGDPNDCNSTVQGVANVAAAGLAGTPSIQTFVIGVGKSLTSLDAIALAGGTTKALIVDTTADPTKQFIDAMNKIRDQVTVSETHDVVTSKPVPCQWTIPPSPDGKTFDKTKVNLDYTLGTAAPTRVGYVASVADCANVDQGWYYDNADSPTEVLVCPQTCTTVSGTKDAGVQDAIVQVVFGCATEKAKIR